MPKPRSGTSYRLSEDAQELLGRLAGRLGLTKTSVVEMAIRKLAFAELGEEDAGVDPRLWSKPTGVRGDNGSPDDRDPSETDRSQPCSVPGSPSQYRAAEE